MYVFFLILKSAWLFAGLLKVFPIPYTLIVMKPLANSVLHDMHSRLQNNEELRKDEVSKTLHLWNLLHTVRTVVSIGATAACIYASLH